MNNQEKINLIVGILLSYQSKLSDGYEYYTDGPVIKTLREIAQTILNEINKPK